MRNRWKILCMCLVLIAAVLLEPVSYVRADEEDTSDRTTGIPRLNASEVLLEKKDFFDWFGFKDVPDENVIEKLILVHRELEDVDYSLYDLQCDFELKTLGSGEEIITSTCSYTIDFENYFLNNWFFDGVVENILDLEVNNEFDQSFTGDDYFRHEFDYKSIVKHAEGFDYCDVDKDDYIYNTVISQVDFYFVRKSDGEKGEARRFKFTWDSDFWLQKCTKIEFFWYRFPEDPEESEGIEKEIGFVENSAGVDGYSSNTLDSHLNIDEYAWSDILWLLVDIPAAIVGIVVGFVEIMSFIADLFKAAFPFIPGMVFDIFAVFILLTIAVAVYKMVFGD